MLSFSFSKHIQNVMSITLLLEGDEIISTHSTAAETFNTYFANVAVNLDIEHHCIDDYSFEPTVDTISNITERLKNHTSILTIKGNVKIVEHFHFSAFTESQEKVNPLDERKPTTLHYCRAC